MNKVGYTYIIVDEGWPSGRDTKGKILAGHPIEVWPQAEWDQPVVLCGACGNQLTIAQYMASGYNCPICNAAFNAGCRNH